MEIQTGPCKDYSPFKRGAISVSMLVGASVTFMVQSCNLKVAGVGWWVWDVQGSQGVCKGFGEYHPNNGYASGKHIGLLHGH